MLLLGDVAVDVAVDLARGGEDDRQLVVATVFKDVKGQRDILHRAVRVLHQLVDFGIGCQMHHDIRPWVWHAADSAREVAVGRSQILEQRGDTVGPAVDPAVHAKDVMAGIQ